MSKQFYFEQFSLALGYILNVKTVLFFKIQFSINTQFKCKNSKHSKPRFTSIWPIDRTLSSASTPSQSGPGSDDNEEYSAFPKAPVLLEPHD